MTESLKIGVVGLGTVGGGTIAVLEKNADLITARAGRAIEIVGVNARNKAATRLVDISKYEWYEDPFALIDDVDVLVEMVGGSEGFAYKLVTEALGKGTHVITANKALLAHHGGALAKLAEDNNVSLMYEASVAGGIPIIKAVRESLAGNQIDAIYGILNGTSNYIMTVMRETGAEFEDVLQQAQDKGYAEADPAFDVEGIDAGHKVTILAANSFGMIPDFTSMQMTGIQNITRQDVLYAYELGYKIKLIGLAKKIDGRVLQIVEPCLVAADSPFASIEDVYNAVHVSCDYSETPLFTGLGAGAGPTASSVVADIIDIARGVSLPTFSIPADRLERPSRVNPREVRGRFFVRFEVIDKPGVVADIATILRDQDVSIATMTQHGHNPGQNVNLVITTHDVLRENIEDAVSLIKRLEVVSGAPSMLRIEDNI